MFLHLEVLRYSSSASTIIRIPFYTDILVLFFIIRVIYVTTSLTSNMGKTSEAINNLIDILVYATSCVYAINLCTGTSIALFYCTVVRSEHLSIALASEIE